MHRKKTASRRTKKKISKKKQALQTPQRIPYTQHKQILILILAIGIVLSFVAVTLSRQNLPDNRATKIDLYFKHINAPLAGHGNTFIVVADSCGMDWRLLPAIAMQESTGGKRMQLNNPFGWGGARIPYDSLDDAIVQVGNHLCGNVSSTARWYNTTSTAKKLYYYNGTVQPSYGAEVMWIMEQISKEP